MQRSPRLKAEPESPEQSPLFTIGAHALSHVPRGWERTAGSPKKRPQRKGTKVWKRQIQEERNALVSAQLLNDLEASLNTHAAKRQRITQAPATAAIVPKEASYTSTLSDTPGSTRKRKPATRRKSVRSPVKSLVKAEGWLSPTKTQTIPGDVFSPLGNLSDPAKAAGRIPVEGSTGVNAELSFLDLIDVSGGTMFDEVSSSEMEEADAGSDDATVDFEEDEGNVGHEDDADADESTEASEDDEETARLADAGNTGVVRLQHVNEFDDFDLDDTRNSIQTSDMSPMQMHVASLLRSPPKITEVMEDRLAVVSWATESETPKTTPDDSFLSNQSPTPTLGREDTTSTVAFEDLDVSGLLFGTEPSRSGSTGSWLSDITTELDSQRTASPAAASPAAAKSKSRLTELAKVDSHSIDKPVTAEIKAEPADEESADELDGGTPTQHRFVRSPKKEFPAGLPPTQLGSRSQLSDDTTYLNDFLLRVRSQAAARAQEVARSPVKSASSRQSPRRILGALNTNSPSPSPVRTTRMSPGKENSENKYNIVREMGSPVKLPRTPAAKALFASSSDSPETPDELSSAPPPPSQTDPTGEGSSARRSGRSRLPAPSRLPTNAPSNIPLRRTDGEPPVLLRTEAQTLARTTAANTRRNKGGARFPKQVIEILDAKDLSPMKPKGNMKNRKGQNVDWDHRLVYFLEDTGKEVEVDADGKLIEKENGKEVKRRVRIIKGEKVILEEEDSEDQLGKDSAAERKPENICGHDHSVQKVDKAPRRIKSVSTKSLTFELPGANLKPPVAEEPKPSLAKPRRAKGPTTLVGLKGTPAVRRMLSVEINTPILPAARRRLRPT